ncbi:MAG TPA: SsrA-binding protein SmpB [Acidimicrobiales bacterium]|nr:SsrA-binding protein SmpB [Acidimicrobiales bacterium]
MSLGDVQHAQTLTTCEALGRVHYAGTVARAKQIQERRAKAKADAAHGDRVVATNRRARHDYEILETLECGIMLTGSEVKSLREGKAQIVDSYARLDEGELWLFGAHIPPWTYAVGFGSHDPERRRKLLVHRHQLDQLRDKTRTQPLTIIPLKMYFKDGRAKVEIALARGRKQHDRRQELAKRDAEREIARTVRNLEKFG